jgi:hypothetical protein
MDIKEIRRIASRMVIDPKGLGKAELIRAIQRAEGNPECFGSAVSEDCDEEGCLWREDCFFESASEEIIR